ncbi:hypothetical protein M5C99_00755 [Acidovorax sp. NCPPB 2350]|nr:hypothetical protein M5C99_00755 [Acidovorax sp. NCPPB 2350]
MRKKQHLQQTPQIRSIARRLLEAACLAEESGDRQEAIRLYLKSVRNGSSEAAVNLANIYTKGRRDSGRYLIAKRLYRMAYRQGCIYGATALGLQYREEGKAKLAIMWLERAANMGEEWASETLHEMRKLAG